MLGEKSAVLDSGHDSNYKHTFNNQIDKTGHSYTLEKLNFFFEAVFPELNE